MATKNTITVDTSDKGTCVKGFTYVLSPDGHMFDLQFTGGCNGLTKAIANLVQGKSIVEVYCLLNGITCGNKSTSCGDQLAISLKENLDKLVKE